ncbi:MAG: hypothetical protein HYV14_04450 [Elusimicrobia bacterium]|nr:hypothetical protein [Elusimicrobiota bacterium]
MTEIRVKFDLTFSRRVIVAMGAFAMMLCAVPELDSESVTLSTYYPAPSGVYTKMITTGDTTLARDGGMVGIGTTAPNEKLTVIGRGVFTDKVYAAGYYGTGAGGVNSYSMEVGGPGPTSVNGNATLFLHHHGVIAHQLRYTNGDLNLESAGNGYGTNVSPNFFAGGNLVTRAGQAGYGSCTMTTYGLGVQNCPAGRYATFTSGVVTKWQTSAGTTDPGGTMLCCACPTSGCPSL